MGEWGVPLLRVRRVGVWRVGIVLSVGIWVIDDLPAGDGELVQNEGIGRISLRPTLSGGVGGVGTLCEECFDNNEMATLDRLDERGHAGVVCGE